MPLLSHAQCMLSGLEFREAPTIGRLSTTTTTKDLAWNILEAIHDLIWSFSQASRFVSQREIFCQFVCVQITIIQSFCISWPCRIIQREFTPQYGAEYFPSTTYGYHFQNTHPQGLMVRHVFSNPLGDLVFDIWLQAPEQLREQEHQLKQARIDATLHIPNAFGTSDSRDWSTTPSSISGCRQRTVSICVLPLLMVRPGSKTWHFLAFWCNLHGHRIMRIRLGTTTRKLALNSLKKR